MAGTSNSADKSKMIQRCSVQIGDLVKLKGHRKHLWPIPMRNSGSIGIIVKLFEKKCWRTHELGQSINWDIIDPEPHAEVIINENVMSFPITELTLT